MAKLYDNPHRVPEHEHGSWGGCALTMTTALLWGVMHMTFTALEIIRPGVVREAAQSLAPWLFR